MQDQPAQPLVTCAHCGIETRGNRPKVCIRCGAAFVPATRGRLFSRTASLRIMDAIKLTARKHFDEERTVVRNSHFYGAIP